MTIPHSRLDISTQESNAVAQVVASGALAQGEQVEKFESSVASFLGVKGGVAVSSGTSAIHLALIAMGVKSGDEVILPSYVCVAPLNAIHYIGAVPVVADVDSQTGNISAQSVEQLITSKTKAVIVPHMMGYPAEIDDLLSLGIPVLEDNAQSIGAKYKGEYTGKFGKASICSFYATKVFACGEGGMVLSDDDKLLQTVRDFRDYDEKTPYKVRYNYKMTDFQAVLGLNQLKRLPQFISARRKIAAAYDNDFQNVSVQIPLRNDYIDPIFFRYVLRIDHDVDQFLQTMGSLNVTCRNPIYKPLYELLGLPVQPHADRLYKSSVSIPIYPTLSEPERQNVVRAVMNTIRELEK